MLTDFAQINQEYVASHSKALHALYSLLSIESIESNETGNLSRLSCTNHFMAQRPGPQEFSNRRFSSSEASTPISGMSTINLIEPHSELGYLSWHSVLDRCDGNIIPHPIKGSAYDYLGCFPLGSTVSRQSFLDVVRSQQVSDILKDFCYLNKFVRKH